MGKIILAGVVLLICMVLGFIAKKIRSNILAKPEDRRNHDEKSMLGQLSIASKVMFTIGIIIPLGVLIWSSFRIVQPGYTGVVVVMGKANETPLQAGLNMVIPLAEVHPMSVKIQKLDNTYDAASKDLQQVSVMMVLNYSLVPAQSPKVFREIGMEYAPTIINPAAQEVLKAEIALHNASEILQTRPEIKRVVQENLAKWLDKYGVHLHEVSLSNIDFSDEYDKAIENKQLEEQKAKQKEYELLQAVKEAEIAKATAAGKADAVIEDARGQAESLKLRGEAQAEYNKKVAESLTPDLIAREQIEKWDGTLPRMMTSSGAAGFLFQVDREFGKGNGGNGGNEDKK